MTKPAAEDLMQHHGHLVRRAMQVLNALWDAEVSRSITSPQFAAMNALYKEPNLDQRTLGRRISFDRSTTAEVVARLCERGLTSSERDPRDGRRKTIALSAKGVRQVQLLIPRTRALTDRFVASLDEKQRAELLRLLTEVVRANESR